MSSTTRTTNDRRTFLACLAVAASLSTGTAVSAETFTWMGTAGDGLWQTGQSQTNWSTGVYAPGNGGNNSYVFAGAGWNADVTTVTIKNDPNVANLTLNNTANTPVHFVIDAGHLDFNSTNTPEETLTVGGGAGGPTGHVIDAINGGYVYLQGNDVHQWRISGSTGVLTVNAPIGGSGVRRGIEKRGDGLLRLNGDNYFSGKLDIQGGVVELGSMKLIGQNSAAGTGTRYGTMQIGSGSSALSGTLAYIGAGEGNSDLRINLGRSTSETPVTTQVVRILSRTGTLNLSGGIVANEGGLPDHNVRFELGGDGNININRNDPNAAYYANVNTAGIFGGINLNKVGAGTVRINADSLWRGTTTVAAGTLLINANHTVPTPYSVLAGGTLGGAGSIAGSITVDTGAKLSPGDLAGGLGTTLTANGPVTLNGGLSITLTSTATYSSLAALAGITFGPDASLAITWASGLVVGSTFNIINGSISGIFAGLGDGTVFTSGSSEYRINYSSASVALTLLSNAPAAIPGDFNRDGFVDAADYTVWADHFGQTGTGVAGDGNNDGVVDAADYTVWADHFGQGTPSVSAVPEPTALAFAAPALALLARRRRA